MNDYLLFCRIELHNSLIYVHSHLLNLHISEIELKFEVASMWVYFRHWKWLTLQFLDEKGQKGFLDFAQQIFADWDVNARDVCAKDSGE